MYFESNITTQQIEKLRVADFLGEIYLVESVGKVFDEAIEYLGKQRVIGFDTETKPCFVAKAPRNRMAILQLSGPDKAYIFRLQEIGVPHRLAQILADPAIIKVGAAVRDDIRGLEKYTRFEAAGFQDLQSMAEKFGIEEKSVRKMAAIILGVRVSKSQQLSNWESARLTDAQLKYAAIDAWVCREMYLKLINS